MLLKKIKEKYLNKKSRETEKIKKKRKENPTRHRYCFFFIFRLNKGNLY